MKQAYGRKNKLYSCPQTADVILVMKDGHIIEKGNHEELLAAGGFYKNLYESQFDTATA